MTEQINYEAEVKKIYPDAFISYYEELGAGNVYTGYINSFGFVIPKRICSILNRQDKDKGWELAYNTLKQQGNLLLEFAEEIYPVEEAILQALEENHLPIDDDFAEGNVAGAIFGAEWQKEQSKASIPTDKEIEKKANVFAHEFKWDDSSYKGGEYGFYEGYKQALKDLGYM
jgi:hypothetical protein